MKNTSAITKNELAVLAAIDASEYGVTLTDEVWYLTIADHCDLAKKSISGAVGSLSKKGLVRCSSHWVNWGYDDTLSITAEGSTAYRAAIAPKPPQKLF